MAVAACWWELLSDFSSLLLLVFPVAVNLSYLSVYTALIILNGTGVFLVISGKMRSVPDKTKMLQMSL